MKRRRYRVFVSYQFSRDNRLGIGSSMFYLKNPHVRGKDIIDIQNIIAKENESVWVLIINYQIM